MQHIITLNTKQHSFCIIQHYVFYLIDRIVNVFDLENKVNKQIDKFSDVVEVGKYKNNICYFVTKNGMYLYHIETAASEFFENLTNLYTNGKQFVNQYRSASERYIEYIDIINTSSWKQNIKPGKYFYVTEHQVINTKYLNDSIVISYSINNGSTMWTTDLTTIGSFIDPNGSLIKIALVKIVGLNFESLYILLNDGRVCELDIYSGSIKRLINNTCKDSNDYYNKQFSASLIISNLNHQLIEIYGTNIYEIDFKTLDCNKTKLFESNDGIIISEPIEYYQSILIFVDNKNHVLGLVNVDRGQLIFLYKLNNNDDILNYPQVYKIMVTKDYIGLLQSNNQIRVYSYSI